MCKLIFLMTVLVLALCIKKYGYPDLTALDFTKVYEIRSQIIMGFPLTYIIPWFTKIVIPIGVIFSIDEKRYLSTILMIAALFIFYLIFASKSFFFTAFLIVAVYIACNMHILYECIYYLIPAVTISGIALLKYYDMIMPISLLVRRVLFVPAQLKFVYFEFFSKNIKNHFADGQIGKLFGIESNYAIGVAKTIGEYMGTESWANTGYLGDSYGEMGFAGMIVLSVVIVIFLKALELLTVDQKKILVISASSLWIYSLNDSALLTALLTGGGIILLFLFSVCRGDKRRIKLE